MRRYVFSLLVLAALIMGVSQYFVTSALATLYTFSLPKGTWDINGNGSIGQLNITYIDSQGKISGTVYGNQIQGFWDEGAKKIVFVRVISYANPSMNQVYSGYLFKNTIGSTVTYTLAGYFEAFSGTGGMAQRHVFSWFAQIDK